MLTKRARAEKNVRYYQKYQELAKDKQVADYLFSLFEYAKTALSLNDIIIKQLEDIFLE